MPSISSWWFTVGEYTTPFILNQSVSTKVWLVVAAVATVGILTWITFRVGKEKVGKEK
jgi:hypothetical protein